MNDFSILASPPSPGRKRLKVTWTPDMKQDLQAFIALKEMDERCAQQVRHRLCFRTRGGRYYERRHKGRRVDNRMVRKPSYPKHHRDCL